MLNSFFISRIKAFLFITICITLTCCEQEDSNNDVSKNYDSSKKAFNDKNNKTTSDNKNPKETKPTKKISDKQKVYSIYGKKVVAVRYGPKGGFQKELMPNIVLGAPHSFGKSGQMDVVSLGIQGSIIIDFGTEINEIDGPELFIFENPFKSPAEPGGVFAELGRISVSDDLSHWTSWPCKPDYQNPKSWEFCAGKTPTLDYDASKVDLEPSKTGGDVFDLQIINVASFRYVKIEDIPKPGNDPIRFFDPKAGFDLDAVGARIKN